MKGNSVVDTLNSINYLRGNRFATKIGNTGAMTTNSEFGRLLKEWRSLRNLSQLDLSVDAGISQRHISFLESGRSKPSREIILLLAEVLNLPLRERNAILLAAGYASVYQQRDLSSSEMQAIRQALELTLRHHEPYPALVADRDWNMLMANNSMQKVFGLFGNLDALWKETCPDGAKNLLRLTCHENGLRKYCDNWEELGPMLLMRSRREANLQGNAELNAMLDEIATWPGIPDSWTRLDIQHAAPPIIPMSITQGGLTIKLFSLISTFGTAHDVTAEELRVECFFPADERSKQLITALAG